MKIVLKYVFNAICLFAVLLHGTLAFAQDDTKNKKLGEATERVFATWLVDNGIKDGAMVVMRSGEVIHRYEKGNRKVDKPVTIASLTKAFTGACVAQLIDAGQLQLTDKLADVLKVDLANLDKPIDARFNQITISDLLRNRSGFSPSADYTLGGMANFLRGNDRSKKNHQSQMDQITRFVLASDPGSTYFYLNLNWLLLGSVIERVTGESYENYCYKAILKPINLPAFVLSPEWTMMSSYGGWYTTAQDYARFADQLGRSVALRKGPVNEWLLKLNAEVGAGKPFYALGTNIRITPRGRTFWHAGSWLAKGTGVGGSFDDSFGSLFVSYDHGVTYMMHYSNAMQGKAGDLERLMGQAIRESLQ
ncbi:MAG TPA: serine hydrolase domain-containing protein [Burkholderiaceae bacterium]|nr:serine hydrolase domain-containing protein [Burkholderiaceae bacterium]